MEYKGVCISVKDVKLSKKFYQDLFGLKVFQDYGANVSFYGGLSIQERFSEIIGVEESSIVNKPHNMELYFEVIDFDSFIDTLSGHSNVVYLDKNVKVAPWGQRSIKFYDLDNHLIEVGENLCSVIDRFLKSGLTLDEISKRMDMSIEDLKTLLGVNNIKGVK